MVLTGANDGVLALSGNNASLAGPTIVSNGTWRVDGAAALSGSSAVTLRNGTTLDLRSDTDATFSPASLAQFSGNGNSFNIRG
jgi:hypothetical protein